MLYRENEQGNIENVYTLKVMNKAQREQTFVIEASGLDGLVYEGPARYGPKRVSW